MDDLDNFVDAGFDVDPLKEKREKRFLKSETARKARKGMKEIKEAVMKRAAKEEEQLQAKRENLQKRKSQSNDNL